MKNLKAAALLGLCALSGSAFAEECIKVVNAGAATVQTQMYEQQCALLSFSSGLITRDYTFNCCGQSAVIRVNYNDWDALRTAGKLDGLRYQLFKKEGDTYYMIFRKIVGTEVTTIPGEDLFK